MSHKCLDHMLEFCFLIHREGDGRVDSLVSLFSDMRTW